MPSRPSPPIIELRQYTLHPGQRDVLIALFDREFVESQEAVGIQVLGQFRNLDRPDTFTWLRGFDSMPSRASALGAFYDGPVWTRHRDAANATMIDSDNVLLLKPVNVPDGFWYPRERPGANAREIAPGLLVATICTPAASAYVDFARWFSEQLAPILATAGGAPLATLETEPSANSFPRLPVREGERVFVWFSRFDDVAAFGEHRARFEEELDRAPEVKESLSRQLRAPMEILRLTPTARSRLAAIA
jgi:hypothetical protein